MSLTDHAKRLETIGTVMRALTIGLMLATPVVFALQIGWKGPGDLLPVPRDVAFDLAGLSSGGLLAATGLAALKPAVFLAALWLLQDLFGLYRRRVVFDARNVRRIRQLGWALIGIDVVEFVQRLSVGPLLTYLGASEPFLTLSFGFSFAVVGAFVIVIARVMDLGRELREFEELAI